jgi:hypothetical protein
MKFKNQRQRKAVMSKYKAGDVVEIQNLKVRGLFLKSEKGKNYIVSGKNNVILKTKHEIILIKNVGVKK